MHARFGTGESVPALGQIGREALYLLAAPSTSPEARAQALGRAGAGEHLGIADVRAIVRNGGAPAVLQVSRELRADRNEIRHAERIERIAAIAEGNTPLPTGRRYPIILADPPWRFYGYTSKEAEGRALDYPTLSESELCALPIADLATDPDAILFLWTTSAHLR